MVNISDIVLLTRLRMQLILKQRLGLMSLGVVLFFLIVSYILSTLTFVNVQKMFWDFALGCIFIVIVFLTSYMSTQVFSEESSNKTLHLVLSSGCSRANWLLSNILGVFIISALMVIFWTLIAWCFHYALPGSQSGVMIIQAQILLIFELLILSSLGFLLSIYTRSIVAFASLMVVVVFLHSLDGLEMVFRDHNVGGVVESHGQYNFLVFWIARLFPPLAWLDVKSFVGYETQIKWLSVLGLFAVSLGWAMVIFWASLFKFKKMDL